MRRPIVSTCLAFALVLGSAVASAEPAPVATERSLDDTLQGAAKDAYGSAKILFNNSDFAGAATKYSQAYDLSKDPRLLFNLAICEKNLRHYARAQGLLQQYEREMGATIAADDKAMVDAALGAIRSLVGTVKLVSTEPGASVLVDGQVVGTTPLATPLLLDLGKHTVTVKKEGFATSEQTVDVAGGNETAVAVTLTAETHTAHLLVQSGPESTVTLDQNVAGKGRFDGKVASGVHSVLVTEPGRLPYKAEIDLKDGETRSVNVTLESEKHGVLWPWIVGGVAVAAGAAVGGYFLFKPQDTTTPVPPGRLAQVSFSAWER